MSLDGEETTTAPVAVDPGTTAPVAEPASEAETAPVTEPAPKAVEPAV